MLVTGNVGDPLWYQIENRDGLRGFVIGSLVRMDEDATPIDLALWPDEADGTITLTPIPPFEIRLFDPDVLTAEDKRQIQRALIYLGHYDGVVDGQFGQRSFDAIRAFQHSQGDAASGLLSLRQYRALIQSADDRLPTATAPSPYSTSRDPRHVAAMRCLALLSCQGANSP